MDMDMMKIKLNLNFLYMIKYIRMSEDNERPTQKYAESYRKCAREYYERNREKILAKKKEQYDSKKINRPPKENKEKIQNYYLEVYKPRKEQEKIEKLKEQLKDMSLDEILNNFKLYLK
jgi:hypothetical protein